MIARAVSDPTASFKRALAAALNDAGAGGRAVIGIEPGLPVLAQQVLADELPDAEIRDASASLERARRIKTAREIALLREAALVASAAQIRLAELAASSEPPGSDVDVWVELLRAMDTK